MNDMTVREYIEQHPEVRDRLKADRAHIPPDGRQDCYMVGRGDGIFIAIYRLIEMGMLKEEDGLQFLGVTSDTLNDLVQEGQDRRTRILKDNGKLHIDK